MSGKLNEDAFLLTPFLLNGRRAVPTVLAIVSDGIGGHRAGEVAARMTVEGIAAAVKAAPPQGLPAETLRDAIIQASDQIYHQAEAEPEQRGMGATCACAWVVGNRLYTAWVGDSRIYLARAGSIFQLTTDHTWIQEAIENGSITAEQARSHPNAHVIRRYLGSKAPVLPDLRMRLKVVESDAQAEANQGLLLLPGDQILLCSDGLTDLVGENELLTALQAASQGPAAPTEAVDQLIGLANERGGHDNITVIVLQAPESLAGFNAADGSILGMARARFFSLVGVILLTMVLIGISYAYLTRPGPNPTPTGTQVGGAPTVSAAPTRTVFRFTLPSLTPSGGAGASPAPPTPRAP
jgi:protein phosphatase